MCLAAFSVDNVLSIFAIGGIMPNSSTCDAPVVRPGVVRRADHAHAHVTLHEATFSLSTATTGAAQGGPGLRILSSPSSTVYFSA